MKLKIVEWKNALVEVSFWVIATKVKYTGGISMLQVSVELKCDVTVEYIRLRLSK